CTPHVSVALAALGARVTQLDSAPAELEKARELAGKVGVTNRVRLVVGDAFRPPFAPDSFDVVWNSGFIEHFNDPVQIIQIMADLVRPSGMVCVLTPAPFTPHSLVIRGRLRRRNGYYWDYMG